MTLLNIIVLAATLLVGVLLGATLARRLQEVRDRRQAAVQRSINEQWRELGAVQRSINEQWRELGAARLRIAEARHSPPCPPRFEGYSVPPSITSHNGDDSTPLNTEDHKRFPESAAGA
jgi:hypothetical protein